MNPRWYAGWWSAARRCYSPNFGPRPAGMPVSLLVVHSISLPPGEYGGDAIERLFTNRLDWDAHAYFQGIRGLRVSAHFLVRRDGQMLQFVSCERRAWHAGRSAWRGRENCNDYSIGIELEGLEGTSFEPVQYTQLARLLRALSTHYPIDEVVGHEDVAPGRKADPGPGFDWLRLLHERDEQLRGAGGHLRPSALCLDPASAADRCAFLRRWPEGLARRSALPLPALARRIGQALGPRPLQALVLGIGEGTAAVRLAQGLLAETAVPRLELCLCDPSLPLLCAALRRAKAVLPGPPRLHLDAVAGQLDPLGCWLATEPLTGRDRAARLFALLDGALADLDEEARALRYGLPGAAPGDLLLLDFEAAAPDRRSDEPWPLSQPLPGPLIDWLAGLIRRARRDVVDLSWHTEPEPHRALPASRALSIVATVRCRDRRGLHDRRFVLYQRRRYDPEALAACLDRWGWERLLQLRYGPRRRGVALLCRRAAPARATT